ncbi:MAG TPA: nicotinate-nucleotide adenylyltransferase [Nitrospinota bacterium]|nr:nicotinate-nucleotide adenylyltransferase [Nitrospinota bacterium]
MRIGLIGGTFNPIHKGHLKVAGEIFDRFKLDSVIFIPSSQPPHKKIEKIAESFHRLCMVAIATLHNPNFMVSFNELMRKGHSYSIKTLEELKNRFGKKTEFYFTVGIDAFLEISTWKDVDLLFKNCHFIVNSRPGYEDNDIIDILSKTVQPKYKNISFKLLEKKGNYKNIKVKNSKYSIFVVEIPALNISSTAIRKKISEGKSVSEFLPKGVEAYIKKNKLYINNK